MKIVNNSRVALTEFKDVPIGWVFKFDVDDCIRVRTKDGYTNLEYGEHICDVSNILHWFCVTYPNAELHLGDTA